MANKLGYNERLFTSSRIRGYYHLSRYRWLEEMVRSHVAGALRVIELGCFDAKSVSYLPAEPERYVGLDANWEGGLDAGRAALADRPGVTLIETTDPRAVRQFADGAFNVAIALETLEHIPDVVMREYLAELARVTDGHVFISVPNEMGPVFLAKYLVKRFGFGAVEPYAFRELIAATLRRPDKVARREHKGFSYVALVAELKRHFDVLSVKGVPALGLPPALSLTVGILARTRQRSSGPA